MTLNKFIPALAALLLPAFYTTAQQPLEQDITVEHEVVPERRDVSRLNFMPVVTLPAVKTTPLAYSSRNLQITVPGTITTLQPAAFADTLAVSPYRGYAALGIFPLYNLGATVGYKFIDNDHTRLAAFMQYDGSLYKGHILSSDGARQSVRNNTGLLDITLHQAVGSKSFIDAVVELELARYNMPTFFGDFKSQGMHRIAAEASWISHFRKFDYEIGLRYSNFGYSNTIKPISNSVLPDAFSPVTENRFNLDLKARKTLGHYSTIGAEVDFSYIGNSSNFAVHTNNYGGYTFTDAGKFNHALLRLYPYYRFDINKFRLDLGARLDFTFNSGKAIHIAPRALASWKPSKMLTIFAKAGGGEHQNTLLDLYEVTPYAQTFLAYGNSHIPLTLDAGITFGTFHGFYAKASAGYARANNWMMPVYLKNYAITLFKPINMRGMYWRAEAGFSNRLIEVTASYQAATQGYNKGYYLWRDRAKGELEGKIKVTPVKPLDVSMTYTWRHGRVMINRQTFNDADVAITTSDYITLGDVRNLSLGGTYRYTDRISMFVTFNNILNRHYFLPGLVEAQGLNGLIGATYKF